MIFEKLQFAVYERFIKLRFLLFIVVLVLSAWTFYSITMKYKYSQSTNIYMQQCFTKIMTRNITEQGYLMNISTIIKMIPVVEGAQQQCKIMTRENSTVPYQSGIDLFRDISLEYLNSAIRQKHKIDEIIVLVNKNKITSQMVFDYFGVYQIFVSQLSQAITHHNLQPFYIKDHLSEHGLMQLRSKQINSFFKIVLEKMMCLCASTARVFFGSIIAGAISITFTIMIIRTLIMLAQIIFRITGSRILFKYFPFLNDYLEGLRQSGRRTYFIKYIVAAYFILSVFMFYGLLEIINGLFLNSLMGFYYSYANTLGLFYIVIIEFISLITLRSRITIKYSPLIIIKVFLIGQYLASTHHYSLPFFYLQLAFQISCIYLTIMLITLQYDISNSRQLHIPSKQHPRTLYFPSYNIGWHSTIPPIWTYFVPLHDRSFFHPNQLCYVNGQFQHLYCILMGLPYNNDQVEDLRDRPHPIQNQIEIAHQLL